MTLVSSGRSVLARAAVVVVSVLVFLVIAPRADATITNVFSATAAPIPCATQASGVRLCDQTIAGNPGGTSRSTVASFDGVPIDVRVAFPPEPASGPDGPWPLIMMFHGYAGAKLSLANMTPFAETVVSTKPTYLCSSETRDVTSTACQAFARSGPDRTNSREATGALAKVISRSRQRSETRRTLYPACERVSL